MIKQIMTVLSVGSAVLVAATGAAAAAEDPTGVWLDQAGRGAVEIAPCGEGGGLCGRVVWVKSASHQKRCGEQILGSLKKIGDGTWSDGWIYSPDRGRKFDVELKQVADDKLRVIGWAGIRMFSETHYWKRASPDLVRCGGDQPATAKPKSDIVAAASPISPSSAEAPAAGPVPPPLPRPAAEAKSAGETVEKPAADAVAGGKSAEKKPSEKRSNAGGGTSGLPPQVEKYFKRSADGTCKVDTPWVQVKFDCKRL